MRAFFMYTRLMLLLLVLAVSACKAKKEFSPSAFTALSAEYGLLSEKEREIVEINMASVQQVDIHIAAYICKKVNLQTTTEQLNLDIVNPDSNFNYLKFFREQLFTRSKPNAKGPIFLHSTDSTKALYKTFLRVLHDKGDLTSSQYAKINEKLQREPVVFPFVVYEWLQTMP